MSAAAQVEGRRDAIDGAAAAFMVAITFCWGLNQVAVKVATIGYDPVFLTTIRSAIAAACVFAWCRYREIPLFEKDGTLVAGIAAGALFGIEFALMFAGLDHTSAARGALLFNTMPFWVLVGGHFMLGERMDGRKVSGLALAFVGVIMVFSDQLSLPSPTALWGDVLCLAAGAIWGGTIILIKRSNLATARAEKTLLYQLAVSALVTGPMMAFSGPAIRQFSALATTSLLFQAVFVVAVTYVLFFWLMRRYPASGLSSFTFLSPAFSVLCAGLLLGEPLTLRIFAALALIGGGLLLVNRPGRKAAAG